MGTQEEFSARRYAVVRGFLAEETLEIYRHYLEQRVGAGEFEFGDDQSARWFRYKDPLGQALLHAAVPSLQELVGLQLYPTYSYTSVYTPLADLPVHSDRPACEISASVTLESRDRDGKPCAPWPFYIRAEPADVEILLEPGDLVLYRGCEVEHYRKPLPEGRYSASVFLHYVDANGPNRGYRDDVDPDAARESRGGTPGIPRKG